MADPQLTLQAHVPQALQASVLTAVERAQEQRVAQRLRERDASLWGGPQVAEVANRLGWLDVAERMSAQLAELRQFAESVREDGIEHVALLGMGGSSLAPEVLRRSLPSPAGRPRLHVLDSTDSGAVQELEQAIDGERTLFVVSSKSGGTIEPLSMLAHFWAKVGQLGSRFVAITDPGSGLEALARERGFRRVFHGDPHIGGRYSALSPFGIVPAVLAGLDAQALLAGASAASETGVQLSTGDGGEWATGEDVEPMHGLAAPIWLGAALSALAKAGRDKLTFVVPQRLSSLGLWQEQLWAESTGKRGTGILPVADEPLGPPESYGEDRVFLQFADLAAAGGGNGTNEGHGASGGDAHADARIRALLDAGHPVFTLPVEGPLDLGRVFLLSELAVATAGWGLDINPFDQPDVQRAKDATARMLEGFEREGSLPQVKDADEQALRALLADASPPSYVAIMAYLQPSGEFDDAVAELRAAIRDATKATTTFGYGPRFLHSTGQLHKGGPPTGRFLQLLHDGPRDEQIPGKPYGFDTLKNAQATGDLQTLRELGRPAERVRLQGGDPAAALRSLTAKIKEML
jgi:transaldolase / glucose-6-phosphate isomerase